MKMTNKTYDILKWVALVVFPALIAFYGVVGGTCNIPYTQEVITIATALNGTLGTILGISSNNYNKENK